MPERAAPTRPKTPPKGKAAPAPTLAVEDLVWSGGLKHIAGIDEAGRGAWAGPVVAAAVILRRRGNEPLFDCVRDSKQLTAKERTSTATLIRRKALAWGVGIVPPQVVDHAGLSFAGQLAFWRAVRSLKLPPQYLLVDGFPLWSQATPQMAILQGDQRSLSIAAASILAKTTRDKLMSTLDSGTTYGFNRNKGYGSAFHADALRTHGPSEYHRRSFKPVADICAEMSMPA